MSGERLVPLNMCNVYCVYCVHFFITCIFDAIGIMSYVLAICLIRAMNFGGKVSKNKSGPWDEGWNYAT